MGAPSAIKLLELHDRYPDLVKPAIGIHPERAEFLMDSPSIQESVHNELAEVKQIALHILEECLLLARELDLPVILHAVHSMVNMRN